ncbi:tail fiber assembly protein [Shigella boydii]|nr:tail fiber assembly protein [Shigella boydii]
MSGSAFAVTHHAFSSGAGRTSDGNGSHASTLKSPSYTKSVSWQHYRKMGDGRVVWVGKDVTGIEPRNASVIEVPDITANRRITAPGYWFYRNDEFVFDYRLKAEDERDALLAQVSARTGEWEEDLLLGLISDEDKEKLKACRIYAKSLQAMDFSTITDKSSYNAIEWPASPEGSS